MSLRRVYQVDGWLMLVVGFVLLGYDGQVAEALGIDLSGPFMAKFELWKAVSLGGLYGGALMAFGLASLAMARSTDRRFLFGGCGYFVGGHALLTFITFAKQFAVWETAAGNALVLIAALPGAAFVYFMATGDSRRLATGRERELREIAAQEERTRLAQDLHDSVKQQLYSMQTNLAAAQARWDDDRPGSREALDRARDSARDAMVEMLALLDRLKRDPLEAIGLADALRRQAEALGFQTGAVVTTEFGTLPDAGRVAAGAMTSIFRIAQETMANIARHARPSRVYVAAATEGESRFVVTIRDDGRGFTPEQHGTGMGLENMRTRASEIGAQLSVRSAEGAGCIVQLSVPLLDPLGVRREQHRRRLLAGALPLAVVAFVALTYPAFTAYSWPLLIAGATFVAIQGWSLRRLR